MPMDTNPHSGDTTPRPDPTFQTNQLVDKAIDCLREVLTARMDATDKVIFQMQADIRARPEAINTQIEHLHALVEQRFHTVDVRFDGVENQFVERDVRVREAALANTTAINAALQSQKEAAGEQAKSFTLSIDKSEKGTLEQISQQRVLLETTTTGIDGKISDIKDRIARIESTAVTQVMAKADVGTTRAQGQISNSFMLALFVAGISLIGLIAALVRGGG